MNEVWVRFWFDTNATSGRYVENREEWERTKAAYNTAHRYTGTEIYNLRSASWYDNDNTGTPSFGDRRENWNGNITLGEFFVAANMAM